MTEDAQRIALCEWADKHGLSTTFMDDDGCEQVGLLDTNSLDVLHEMVLKLDEKQAMEFCFNLQRVVCGGLSIITGPLVVNATAAQRREALLRTLNLWKE